MGSEAYPQTRAAHRGSRSSAGTRQSAEIQTPAAFERSGGCLYGCSGCFPCCGCCRIVRRDRPGGHSDGSSGGQPFHARRVTVLVEGPWRRGGKRGSPHRHRHPRTRPGSRVAARPYSHWRRSGLPHCSRTCGAPPAASPSQNLHLEHPEGRPTKPGRQLVLRHVRRVPWLEVQGTCSGGVSHRTWLSPSRRIPAPSKRAQVAWESSMNALAGPASPGPRQAGDSGVGVHVCRSPPFGTCPQLPQAWRCVAFHGPFCACHLQTLLVPWSRTPLAVCDRWGRYVDTGM